MTKRVRRRAAALWIDTVRGVMILPPGSEEPVLISSPGETVWRLLTDPATPDELADRLAEIFDAPADVLRRDLERLLDDLDALGVIE